MPGGASRARQRSFHQCAVAVKNCRTLAQAKAVGDVVVQHMIDKGEAPTAEHFKKQYLSERWCFRWSIGAVGPGVSPCSTPQETWHKWIKSATGCSKARRPTDTLLHTVFPALLRHDGTFNCGEINPNKTPAVLPSEYVAQAAELKELPTSQAVFLAADGTYYVKADWTTPPKRRKRVTATWVGYVERGLAGNLGPGSCSLQRVNDHFLGLCKCRVVNDAVQCDCDIFNLYLCCPHSIFVDDKRGHRFLNELTTKVGKDRGVGRSRRPGRALERD